MSASPSVESPSVTPEPALSKMAIAALWYAENGLPVFPLAWRPKGGGCSCGRADCSAKGKHPMIPGGFHSATKDPAIIKSWWAAWPDANIGLPTGPVSGLWVLDIDPKHGGDETLDNLILEYGRFTDAAAVQITGGGGKHLAFKWTGAPIRNSAGKIGPGIDVRGEGGYIVVSPSLHSSGRRYIWDGIGNTKGLLHLTAAPAWLVELVMDRAPAKVSHGQPEAPIPEGQRNPTLTREAGAMRRRGLSPEAIAAALLVLNEQRCQPPLSEAEVRQIAESIGHYAPAVDPAAASASEDKGDEEALPDFPEIAWRGVLADYRLAMAGTTEASDVAHFGACWAAAAVTLGRRIWTYAGERIYPNVYLSLFGPTGDKKTTAQRRILHYVLDPSIKVIRNLGSTEGLADALKRDDGADTVALFFWEELTLLLARGRWSGSTILEFITETFDCPLEWELKYRHEPVRLIAPTPTILSGTTAEWFWKNARTDDFNGGLFNRFLFLTGGKKAPIPNPREPDAAALQRVREAFLRLAAPASFEVRFDAAAAQLWEKFYVNWEQQERAGLYAAAVKRIHVYIRKLAMVYAALEGTLPEIKRDQLKAAIAVGTYAAGCARTLIDAQIAGHQPDTELERKFVQWVERHEGHRKRFMQQCLSRATGGCEVFNRVLTNLVRADQIEIRDNRVYIPG